MTQGPGDTSAPRGRPQPPEPPQRDLRDASGRLQEAEPYAAFSYWLFPIAGVAVLAIGGFVTFVLLTEGMLWPGIGAACITVVLAISSWMGFVQAKRARRSDRRAAQEREERERAARGATDAGSGPRNGA